MNNRVSVNVAYRDDAAQLLNNLIQQHMIISYEMISDKLNHYQQEHLKSNFIEYLRNFLEKKYKSSIPNSTYSKLLYNSLINITLHWPRNNVEENHVIDPIFLAPIIDDDRICLANGYQYDIKSLVNALNHPASDNQSLICPVSRTVLTTLDINAIQHKANQKNLRFKPSTTESRFNYSHLFNILSIASGIIGVIFLGAIGVMFFLIPTVIVLSTHIIQSCYSSNRHNDQRILSLSQDGAEHLPQANHVRHINNLLPQEAQPILAASMVGNNSSHEIKLSSRLFNGVNPIQPESNLNHQPTVKLSR